MTIHRQSLRVVLTDLAASAALLALDLAGRIADRRKPAPEPAEPVVASMPAQRDVTVDEHTLEAAMHDAVVAVARQRRVLPVPVDVLAETIALEVLWYFPAAGGGR